jgi:hypothetical protein
VCIHIDSSRTDCQEKDACHVQYGMNIPLSTLNLQDADGVIRRTRARRRRGGVVAHGRGRGAGGTGEKAYQSRRELA